MVNRSLMRSTVRFVTLIPALIKDTWNEARGRQCSWNCAEGHAYDEWCILRGTTKPFVQCYSMAFGGDKDNYATHYCILQLDHVGNHYDQTHTWSPGRHPLVVSYVGGI